MTQRGLFGIWQWEVLPPDVRQRSIADLVAARPSDTKAAWLKTTLAGKSEQVRQEIRSALQAQGFSQSNFERDRDCDQRGSFGRVLLEPQVVALKDTLSKLVEQDKRAKQAIEDKQKVLEEWKQAVAALLTDVRGHLVDFEKDGSLSLSEDTIRLTEDGLGPYDIPVMKISAGPVVILVQPLGRLIDATSGRIDMHCQGRNSVRQRVTLFRMPASTNGSKLTWHIWIPQEAKSLLGRLRPREKTLPLNKGTLEQAIEILSN